MPLTLVSVTNWPDEITWTYDDGHTEVSHEDYSTVAGRLAIADRAAAGGLGSKAMIFDLLGRRQPTYRGPGVILDRASPVADDPTDRAPPVAMLEEFELPKAPRK